MPKGLPRCRLLVALCMCTQQVALGASGDDLFELSLEELVNIEVTIATGSPKSLRTAPAVATVITSQELEALGVRTLDEALETVPGLHVSYGGVLYTPRYFIRGISSNENAQTLVLVNGVPQTSLWLGDRLPAWPSVPVKAVQRVEIIRGPGSALYGADAFAGVINIITKGPEEIAGTQAYVAHGSFNTTSVDLLHGGQVGPLKAALTVSALTTDGDDSLIRKDLQSYYDSIDGTNASLAPGPLNLGARQLDTRLDLAWGAYRLRLDWLELSDRESGRGTGGARGAIDPWAHQTSRWGNADFSWQGERGHDWQLEARAGYGYKHFHHDTPFYVLPPGSARSVSPDGQITRFSLSEEHARLNAGALYQGWAGHQVRLGVGAFWGDLFKTTAQDNSSGVLVTTTDTPSVFQPENQRTSYNIYIQDEWRFAPGWELTTGLRHDHYSDFGDTTNPRLALVWSTTPTLTSKLLYGEAFRAPAFSNLYLTGRDVRGNPHLQPEKLRSLELAFGWEPSASLRWDLNLYGYRVRDYIDQVLLAGTATTVARNAGRFDGRGVETELRYEFSPALQLLANYSHQQTRESEGGESRGLSPSAEASLWAVWQFAPGWQFTPQVNWVGDIKRAGIDNDPRSSLPGYTILNLALRKRWSQGLELTLSGHNLFDAKTEDPVRTGPAIAAFGLSDMPQGQRRLVLEASKRW